MDVDECIAAYVHMSDRIFRKTKHRIGLNGKVQGRFDSEEFERVIKDIIKQKGFKEDALLRDLPDSPCKVSVNPIPNTLTSG